jgi:hypothetical protein
MSGEGRRRDASPFAFGAAEFSRAEAPIPVLGLIGPAEAVPLLQDALRLGLWWHLRSCADATLSKARRWRLDWESGDGLAVEEGYGERAVRVDGDKVGGEAEGEMAG